MFFGGEFLEVAPTALSIYETCEEEEEQEEGTLTHLNNNQNYYVILPSTKQETHKTKLPQQHCDDGGKSEPLLLFVQKKD